MRKIASGLFISLDGVVEAPETWTGPYMDGEVGQEIGAQMAAADTMLLGRVTYQTFASAFAGRTGGQADLMNNTPKIVVSRTLDTVEWQNTTLLKGDIAQEITALKQQPGRNIGTGGSPTLVRWLLRERLLDELYLLICPIVVGRGKRLFADEMDRAPLTLVASRAFDTGAVSLTYTLART